MTQPGDTIVNQTTNSQPATIAADGTATVQFQPPNGYQWLVTQIATIVTGSTLTGALEVFKGGAFICGSASPQVDSADGGFILLKPSDTLFMKWTGLTPGAQAQGTIYYSIQGVPNV